MEIMKVEFISTEKIKPSSPTPHHLRTHKLSLLDQLSPPLYIPIVLFYPLTEISPTKKSALLKTSLSKTLTHFYPFAGRIKDCYSIDCNDNGATYIEAHVHSDISTVLKEPGIDLLLQLLPCDQLGKFREPSADPVLLAVQVNYFACGGMAIGFCISHVVADGSAAASFLKSWAAIASGIINDTELDGVIYDCTHLFPPQNLSSLWQGIEQSPNVQQAKVVTKRFLFNGSKVAALRDEISNIGQCLINRRPTRVEAVSSLISNALILGEMDDVPVRVKTTVNLRKRMNPPPPQLCIGNIYHLAMETSVMAAKTTGLNGLAEKLHESISKIDYKYIRQLYGSGADLNNVMENSAIELLGKNSKTKVFAISIWCRFPFYGTDFGWGKPVWFGTALNLKNVAIFLDTSDGEGIEAWIGLPEEGMTKLEQDPGILAYASFKPNSTTIHVYCYETFCG